MKDAHPRLSLPWAIEPKALERIAALEPAKCKNHPDLADISEEDFEERLEMDEVNGVAVLRIEGPLVVRPELWERYFYGAADLERIENLIRAAADNPQVQALVLSINSPGGTVTGTPEVGVAVAACAEKKPVFAYTNALMASAAYWIGSQVGADRLFSTPSARVGSVGVLRPHVDLSEMYQKAGIRVEVFTSGKFKGAGAYGTALTEEQRKQIQDEVETLGAQFRAIVTAARPDVDPSALEGQVLYGTDAVKAGLIDDTVPNSSALFARARSEADGRQVDNSRMSMAQEDTATDAAETEDAPEASIVESETASNEAHATSTVTEGEASEEQAQDEAPAAGGDTLAALIRDLSTENASLKLRVAELEQSQSTVDQRAAEKAAEIAAQSGAEVPVELTAAGDTASGTPDKSVAELYKELATITGKDATETSALQRAFYLKHIKPRQGRN